MGCAVVGQVATHSSFRFQAGGQCIHESVSESSTQARLPRFCLRRNVLVISRVDALTLVSSLTFVSSSHSSCPFASSAVAASLSAGQSAAGVAASAGGPWGGGGAQGGWEWWWGGWEGEVEGRRKGEREGVMEWGRR